MRGKALAKWKQSSHWAVGPEQPNPPLPTRKRHPLSPAVHMSCYVCVLRHLSHVWLSATLWTELPDSSVHGILQARTLEWVSMFSSFKGFSQPRDQNHTSHLYLHCQAGSLPLAPSGKSTCRTHASSKLQSTWNLSAWSLIKAITWNSTHFQPTRYLHLCYSSQHTIEKKMIGIWTSLKKKKKPPNNKC